MYKYDFLSVNIFLSVETESIYSSASKLKKKALKTTRPQSGSA